MPSAIDEEEDLDDELPLEDLLEGDDRDLDDDDEDEDEVKPNGFNLTPEQITDLALRAAGGARAPEQRQLSPEELDAKLNRYKPSMDFVKLLRDPEAKPEDVLAKLQEMIDGTAKFATTSSQLLFQDTLSPLQQQLAAQQAFVREQQTNNFVKHTITKYPALAGKREVLKQALAHVSQSGWTPPGGSKSAAQKYVAQVAEQIIRTVDPSFRLRGSTQARQAGSFGRRTSGGGGGGSSGSKVGAASFLDHLR